ncbi:MAG: chorismate synthase [Bacteroidota bacterium]
MSGNTFGHIFRLTTFGESHGAAIGGVIDGCPAGLSLDSDRIQSELSRRRPGQSNVTTARKESDQVELLSGVLDGKTLGTPISFIIRNNDQRSADYDELKGVFRPSHADYTYQVKYGIRDHRGGGRSSARETAARVVAGAIARQLLEAFNIRISAYVSGIGPVRMTSQDRYYTATEVDATPVRCPQLDRASMMEKHILDMKESGDTCGGVITCVTEHLPAGLGEPVFDKLSARLAAACMSINAAHGFEFGSGFEGSSMKGSEHNDPFVSDASGAVRTTTNHSGGIQGGISNGMPVVFRVAFKPVSTHSGQQSSIDQHGNAVEFSATGRHDPCVVPRAVPIVEAMAAITFADMLLQQSSSRFSDLLANFKK